MAESDKYCSHHLQAGELVGQMLAHKTWGGFKFSPIHKYFVRTSTCQVRDLFLLLIDGPERNNYCK
jgi:hypothetical protein